MTDVPFNTGEGSFDKGLTIKAPINWFTGKKSRAYVSVTLKPLTGDGGAKLHLSDEKFFIMTLVNIQEKHS